MSGGFFRGTSADQDTRFSNKQAKLMKSQKFPAELEHLVDMTKVKMDVMKPWIAKRVTELIGFEDEVLINFIYSLLEKKVVNGKEVQISLTGFMERNTGKFMKELWALLLSAQGNASGVPQQFLEAKEEEMRKKKVETDRIADEIQKRKERENRELDEERRKKDDYARNSREKNATLEPSPRRRSTDDVDPVERNGSRGRNRASRSPRSADHSPLLRRSRSISKSFSNSRSHSRERRRSRSASFERRGRSLSSERENHSPPRRSVSPRRKPSPRRSFSPPRHRRRSTSRVRRRSPSPARYRRHSPFRRRSRSPIWRRSRSPMRRRSRSPMRRRSRSPMWRRSRSPRRRSPVRYVSRSPVRRRSPPSIRHRTPSPAKRRSPSPASRGYRRSRLSPRRSPSPVQRKPSISGRKRSTTPVGRSLSPQESLSPSPIYHRSPSPIRKRVLKNERSPVQSPRGKTRSREKHSPVRQASPGQAEDHKGSSSLERRRLITSRSPQRDAYDRKDSRRKDSPLPPPQGRSPSILESPRRTRSDSESPPARRERSPSEGRGPRSTLNWRERKPIATDSPSPMKSNEHRVRSNISEKIADEKEKDNSREFEHKSRSSRKNPTVSDSNKNRGKGLDEEQYSETPSHKDRLELRKRHEVIKSEKLSGRMEHIKDLNQQKSPATTQVHSNSGKKERELNVGESFKADKENLPHTNDTKGKELPVDQNDRSSNDDSGSEEGERHRAKNKDKRKHKRSDRYESSSDGSYESGVEDRKEAKRRRKEERRLKKEEKRRRREERRRKKEERRALKLKSKSGNAMSSPSDTEGNFDGRISDDERVRKKGRNAPEIDGSESLQKRLEIELREKALESLRAKKGINH